MLGSFQGKAYDWKTRLLLLFNVLPWGYFLSIKKINKTHATKQEHFFLAKSRNVTERKECTINPNEEVMQRIKMENLLISFNSKVHRLEDQ